ncbi:hypothetical protein D9757_012029 [Collybiopsis confluens]|uniref:HAT C-terminal dimerisation domain-containing protein n=1 Tax=Collybiopsis confluens TaxID=2823264 RepID=A0A8H5GDT5_9AGAR|nr:hypothetical protein D9757_012029 [Collybiopsis confluens]
MLSHFGVKMNQEIRETGAQVGFTWFWTLSSTANWFWSDFAGTTLSRIARDYLAIQGSATPSERAFSGGALTGTKLRNSLRPEMFQALQILKGAYQNGHISATQQAAQHIVDFMAALDEYDFGDANVDLNDEYNV